MHPLRRMPFNPMSQIVIYKGHENHPLFGPYPDNIPKRIAMFNCLNDYRRINHKQPWKVSTVSGEQLVETLKGIHPISTLLVIPAGQSTRLDKVFDCEQISSIKDFLNLGGRGYFNCGSAYWISSQRIYHDLCEEQPEHRKPIIKTTQLPLFNGISEGPLCPYPGKKYQVGFFSDAVRVADASGQRECTIYLSGGGSFRPFEHPSNKQKVKVLIRYLHSELIRHGKKPQECSKWENAAMMISVGQGAALLSMFHPYYGSKDIDVERYEKTFPDCGTNWQEVKKKLSPLDERMRFVLHTMLDPLENMDFD